MTVNTPAYKFFCMIAASAIGSSVRQIMDFAKANGLDGAKVGQLLTAELLYFACSVSCAANFTNEDLHDLLDEMADEMEKAADCEGAKH